MGEVLTTMKIMPDSPDVDLEAISSSCCTAKASSDSPTQSIVKAYETSQKIKNFEIEN